MKSVTDNISFVLLSLMLKRVLIICLKWYISYTPEDSLFEHSQFLSDQIIRALFKNISSLKSS